MKKILLVLMAFAMVSCTEKENLAPVEPPAPQHNSLYQTHWAGEGRESFDVPILGTYDFVVDATAYFESDSTAHTSFTLTTDPVFQLYPINENREMDCTYTWDDPNGVMIPDDYPTASSTFEKNANGELVFRITRETVINTFNVPSAVQSYVPEVFVITMTKQQ